ncbi:MAG TPA: hypothetical protein VFG47_20370 [Geminicoccaceae bacterium]|nr:hypothetical protein [Geminicoccaceae bacterium]
MWSSSPSSFGLQRHRRRRQQFYRRLVRVGLVVAVLAATASYAYQVGASKGAAVIDQLRAEIAELRAGNAALGERAAAAVQRADEARSRAQAAEERYQAGMPRGAERELLQRIEAKLRDGVAPERLAFVIEQSGLPQECAGTPETKRLMVRTPVGGGAVSAVRFGDGRIVVTGEGPSARNDQGRPEAWFDPAARIQLNLQTLDGRTEAVEGVLPMTHAMVVDGREYRFNVTQGEQRGLVEMTAQSCALP